MRLFKKRINTKNFNTIPKQKKKSSIFKKKPKKEKIKIDIIFDDKKKNTEVKRKLLLLSVILIFMIFLSYNISMYYIHNYYLKSIELTHQIDKVMKEVGETSSVYGELEEIRAEVAFMTTFCYNKEIEDVNNVLQ